MQSRKIVFCNYIIKYQRCPVARLQLARIVPTGFTNIMQMNPPTAAPLITPGFTARERQRAGELFWQAFGGKLAPLLAPEPKAIAFLSRALCPNQALAARAPDGRILGLCGLRTDGGGLFGGSLRDMAGIYGWTGAPWRWAFLSRLDRPCAPGTGLIDGLFVAEEIRDRGIGSALLQAAKAWARQADLHNVQLDVAVHNRRARALYSRHGFVETGVTRAGSPRRLLGLPRVIEMRCDLVPAPGVCRTAAN